MNTRTKKPSTLCAALGGAGLARTGAMLALALGAAQAGATTYTVPLQFNITLSPPVCTLKVLNLTADANTNAPALTPDNTVTLATMAVSKTPMEIVAAMTTTSPLTGPSAGFHSLNYGTGQRFVTTPPTATANCTAGTPMTATITKGSTVLNGSAMGGTRVGDATNTILPIGMYMGIVSFSGNNGASGQTGVTWTTNVPTVPGVATGLDQPIVLSAALYANSTTVLSSDYAGTWIYPFNVNLNF